MQQATWGLDHQGVFVVNAELDQTRYDPTQTRIKWVAKERWQNGVRPCATGHGRLLTLAHAASPLADHARDAH